MAHTIFLIRILPTFCPSVCMSVLPSVRPSFSPSFRPFFYLSVRPSIHLSVRPSIRLFVRPLVCPTFRPIVSSSISPSIYPIEFSDKPQSTESRLDNTSFFIFSQFTESARTNSFIYTDAANPGGDNIFLDSWIFDTLADFKA